MVNSNQKFDCVNNGYIPFDINNTNKKNILDGILILQDGTYFLGLSFGAKEASSGEICFNTSMTGYQKYSLTHPMPNKLLHLRFHILAMLE